MRTFAISLVLIFGLLRSPVTRAADDPIQFNEHIRPILANACLACHGPDAKERKADLRLDVQSEDQSKVIVPNHPDRSELIKRITSADPDKRMPPPDSGKSLSEGEIDLLRQWIESGASFQGHWAFDPIKRYDPPRSNDATLTEIDRFIVAALNERGLSLSPRESRTRLIRRATFNLTGLPPSWAEVEAFVNDPSPQAFETVIDRLLESPRYGERWGRHWLDVARYADTHGGSAIGFKRFPFSYTYRDYVIRSFNKDVPYDQFVTEQLAADQMNLEENDPARAGLGFLTVGRQYRNRHDLIDDQIDVVTRGLLGLTVTCARCHDHKFDPISTNEYYAVHAVLAASFMAEPLPLVGTPKIAPQYREKLANLERLRDDIQREQVDVMTGRLRMQAGLYLRELAKGVPEVDTSTSFLSFRTDDIRPIVLERWRKHINGLSDKHPVFGPWHRLSRLDGDDFATACESVVQALIKENGDPKKFGAEHRLDSEPPKWNPRVLEALAESKPESFVEVADVYGNIFAQTHRRWLSSLLEASAEASAQGKIVPDEDARHRIINSAIERQLRHHLYAKGSPTALDFKGRDVRMLNRTVRDKVNSRTQAIHQLNLAGYAPPRAMQLQEVREPEPSYVFIRGNPVNRGDPVEPGFLAVLSGDRPLSYVGSKRRLALARSIVHRSNPITRRVVVNWVWQHHFGRGLVRTPDDFGSRGTPPTHPELLDYLAETFLEDGWSIKKLHRRIMLSAVYQQAAVENAAARLKDPDNRLLWRMPRRRLEMEAMRDAMLAVSGELSLTMGGKPYENESSRRTVYAFVNRDIVSRLNTTFDGANPTSCTVKRPQTTVPQQTLFALNSVFIQQRAKALVNVGEIKNAKTQQDRVRNIYRRVYGRNPDAEESAVALEFIGTGSGASSAAWNQFAHVLLAANEFHFVD